jgi:light-regulated signal transduction histidine kinase (bacteriophytochrome)
MVASYTQLLKRRYHGRLDQDADDFIDFAVDGARRMQDLINDLLTFSRVGTRALRLEPVDMGQLLEQVKADLAAAIEESGGRVEYAALPNVTGDSTQLRQLFLNLLANAIKFRGDRTPLVTIDAKSEGPTITFAVRDNGIGIEPQYVDRVFVLFQRLHTRAEYPGTGIGLAICKKIVERHGGRIWFESTPGQGTTFYFTLPASAA